MNGKITMKQNKSNIREEILEQDNKIRPERGLTRKY